MTTKKNEGKLLDHNYDGIQELDNPLPRWWVWIFYLSIIFTVFYTAHYWIGPGLSSEEALEQQLAALEASQPVSETTQPEGLTPQAITPEMIAAGKAVYVSKCAACHSQDGGGLIGPNLTDQYWIQGNGSTADIRRVVREGVPEKGMLAWEALLKPDELNAVVAYVKSLQGTTPQTPKAPEGQLVD